MTLRWVPGWNGLTEPEAVSYVAAVEAADGQELEFGVAKAINDFVLGCKNDGIWDAIKACCILAGARTLGGALKPLKGVAPTNNNFVSADYNRKTGLKGNGGTKYLNSNRANNANPQLSAHRVVAGNFSSNSQVFMSNNAFSNMYRFINGSYYADINNGGSSASVSRGSSTSNFVGSNRNGNTLSLRTSGGTTSVTSSSNYYFGGNLIIGQSGLGLSGLKDNMTFYSIGESLDLTKLDTRVTTLMNTFSSVIP